MQAYNFYISAKQCKEHAKDCLRDAWKASAKASILYLFVVLALLSAIVLPSIFVRWWLVFPLLFVCYLVWSLFDYGYTQYFWKLCRLESPTAKDLFAGFSKRTGDVLKTAFKRLFLGIFWLAMLVVPFFIKQASYDMSYYLLMDNNELTSAKVLKESKHLMKKNVGRLYKFHFEFLLWYLLILCTAGFAGIWVLPYIKTSQAKFYEDLKTEF